MKILNSKTDGMFGISGKTKNSKVIEEIKRLLRINYNKFQNSGTFNNRKSYYFGRVVAYREVIDILKRLK